MVTLQRVVELLKEDGIVVSVDQLRELMKRPEAVSLNPAPLRTQEVINGYKIHVEYEELSSEEMQKKKQSVARIIANAMNKIVKK